MEVLTKGTVESLLIPLRDRLNNIASLSSVTNPRFDTKKKSDNTPIETDKPITIDTDYPMTAICEINTGLAGYVAGEEVKLYFKYASGTESPVLGPIFFRVEGD